MEETAAAAAAAARSLQSCPTLCDPIDSSPLGSSVPGILQTRTLEWVAISFSNAWKGKVKGRSLSRVRLLATPMDCSPPGSPVHGFSRQEYWSGVPLPSLMEETKVIIKNQENEIFTLPRTVCYIMKYLDLIISVCLLEVKHEFFSPLLYCYSTYKSLLP